MPAVTAAEMEAQAEGKQLRPLETLDFAIRMGPAGDQMGAREGWSVERLRDNPHGVMLDIPVPYGSLDKIGHADGRIHLWHPPHRRRVRAVLGPTMARLPRSSSSPGATSDRTMVGCTMSTAWCGRSTPGSRSTRPTPNGFVSGRGSGPASPTASARSLVEVAISDEVMPGVVSYPHGWGHGTGSWQRANATAGVNMNVLLGVGEAVVEAVSGTTIMDGIDVELAPA